MTQTPAKKGAAVEGIKHPRGEGPQKGRTLADLALMVSLSVLLVAAAWLWIPQPLVEDPFQTELLYVQVETADRETALWKPKTVVERQTARAIVDRMSTLRKRNTLHPAPKAMEGGPNMYVHFRTEDVYQVLALGNRAGKKEAVSYSQDGKGLALAAQVLQAQELEEYILNQLHGTLAYEGGGHETGTLGK